VWTSALGGLFQVKWNRPDLGIEGPEIDLPVFVSEHAIARLHERLPFPPRFRSLLHILMVNALDAPVVFPADQGKHLVELRYGTGRAGYFVAKVFPGFVLILTFLFLTMEGTPEAKLLREKLGLHRKHIEEYHLDRFFTLTGSDLARDPLLSRVLAECGCGHLITLIEDGSEGKWLDTFGERLKQGFGLREAQGGFKVGRKWVGWSDDNLSSAEDQEDQEVQEDQED
jgi:hypothetical protein